MENKATFVPTHNDDKSNALQDPTKQPVPNQQTLSFASTTSKDLSDSEAGPKGLSGDADDTATTKKSKGRKIKDAGATIATGTLAGLGHLLEAITR
ncbi:hypothetical protein P3342_009292 [Pyrenophora teres f. teres]|uniref:Uncharacterized protein n=1 Tax=Pyrenophora teres f. teres TaxID=97479 RepID=A0A6S6WFV5_9PLEO|nr:hypothetical protein HRS9139_10262 [Pyrenophora teres f. teres]KAE8835028.1 hypothetical protein PTNB85_06361 [Pyrenophora teres f. teres]KAE8843496.1 hypothetical protein HRS9122_04599 [Pyrenophora teres f. teres]KAE8856716.1 hypothetical protein PTNB73_09438 [Pyrenophora teres f. teres]KAE8861317.1 hypothetical protein PTNB29_06412 [Pyrenophora teres f. teres]